MINVEKAFGVKFTSSEVASLKNVGELADLIDRKSPG
jgi:acyl carrier protein